MKIKKIMILAAFLYTSFTILAQNNEKEVIDRLINEWHKAASQANQQDYFEFLSDNAVYIGTDATENWTKNEFFEWSKPYFEKDRAWHFTNKERNIYLSENSHFAWFDEQLEFSGGILRGSGVLVKEKKSWKLKHYVLSLPVPNEKFSEVIELISERKEKDQGISPE